MPQPGFEPTYVIVVAPELLKDTLYQLSYFAAATTDYIWQLLAVAYQEEITSGAVVGTPTNDPWISYLGKKAQYWSTHKTG